MSTNMAVDILPAVEPVSSKSNSNISCMLYNTKRLTGSSMAVGLYKSYRCANMVSSSR
jgi:hypothetical protein